MKGKLIILLLMIVFLHNINFPKNIFDLSYRPYYHRLVRELGQCEKSGFGFVWQVNQMNIGENILYRLNSQHLISAPHQYHEA